MLSRNVVEDRIDWSFTLALVSDLAEKIVPPSDIRLPLYPFRRAPIDDAEYAPALLTLGHDNFDWVCGRAEYRAHFRHVSDRAHHVNRVRILQHQHKRVAASKCLGIAYSNIPKRLVVSF